jgi:hypothetical protein
MRGITVILHERTESGADPFGSPVYKDEAISVENVLVGQPTEQEIADSLNLYQKKAVYTLGIPKGDTHKWESGSEVEFFGKKWRTIGYPVEGIEHLVPLAWNKKVRVEAYE